MEIYEDQMNSPEFMKISDFIWSDRVNDVYVQAVHKAYDMQIVNKEIKPQKSGIIFLGPNQLIEDVFVKMAHWGNEHSFIVIYGPTDRCFTEKFYQLKPSNVKHIYTTNSQVKADNVTPYPMGVHTINSYDDLLVSIAKETVEPAKTKVFCRMNVNNSGYTEERKQAIPIFKKKPFIKVIEEQIPQDEFFRQVKAHKFTMSLKGQGPDAARQYFAISLGSIPIVSDLFEMRFFEDLPLAYCPKDPNDLTEEWLDSIDVSGKSPERIRMSYWRKHISDKRKDLGI